MKLLTATMAKRRGHDGWKDQPRDPGGEDGGQWVRSPISAAIGEAYSRVVGREHMSMLPRMIGKARPGERKVAITEMRQEMQRLGFNFPREQVDAELTRLAIEGGHQRALAVFPHAAGMGHFESTQQWEDLHSGGLRMGGDTSTFMEVEEGMPLPAARPRMTEEQRASFAGRTPDWTQRINPEVPKPKASKRLTATGARSAKAKAPFDAQSVADQLQTMRSVPEGDKLLEPYTVAQLKDIARRVGVHDMSGTKAKLRASITHQSIGAPGAIHRQRLGDAGVGNFRTPKGDALIAEQNAALGLGKNPDSDAQAIKARLQEIGDSGTVEDAYAYVESLGLNNTELDAVIRELDAPVVGPRTKANMHKALVKVFAEGRITSRAVRGGVSQDVLTRFNNETLTSADAMEIARMPRAKKVARIASELHENWRKEWHRDHPGESRPKATKDEAWVIREGTAIVDIAHTRFEDLPSDWRAENLAAAEVVMDLLDRGAIDLSNPNERLRVGRKIHDAWLSRNDYARGGELDVPFEQLSAEEQAKDLAQIEAGQRALGLKLQGGRSMADVDSHRASRPKPAPDSLTLRERRGKVLSESLDREEAHEALRTATIKELRELGTDLGFPVRGRTKDEMRQNLIESTVGNRSNSDVIRNGTWLDEPNKPMREDLAAQVPGLVTPTVREQRAQVLTTATDRAQAEEALRAATVKQLQELASDLGVKLSGRVKADLRSSLINQTVGRREDHQALTTWREPKVDPLTVRQSGEELVPLGEIRVRRASEAVSELGSEAEMAAYLQQFNQQELGKIADETGVRLTKPMLSPGNIARALWVFGGGMGEHARGTEHEKREVARRAAAGVIAPKKVIPKNSVRAPRPRKPQGTIPSPREAAEAVQGGKTRAELDKWLRGLKLDEGQMQELARRLAIPRRKATDTIDQSIERIVQEWASDRPPSRRVLIDTLADQIAEMKDRASIRAALEGKTKADLHMIGTAFGLQTRKGGGVVFMSDIARADAARRAADPNYVAPRMPWDMTTPELADYIADKIHEDRGKWAWR